MAWILWVLMFLAIEGLAIARKAPGDTLTEHLRWLFATRNKPPGWRWRRYAWLAGMAALFTHVLVGWP